MKKKLLAIFIVVALLVSTMSGCLLTINAERDGQQVVATVEYDGLSSSVTKAELAALFDQSYYTYNQYYGWDVEKTVTELAKSLAKRELLLLKARTYFVDKVNAKMIKEEDKIKVDGDLFLFLDPDEQLYVLEQTNKVFEDRFEELVEEVEAENAANKGDDEDEDEDDDKETLEPRTTKTKTEDNSFKPNDKIKKDDVDAFVRFFDIPRTNKTEIEAVSRLEKELKDSYRDYDYYLDQQTKTRMANKFTEAMKADKGLKVETAELMDEYESKISLDLNTIKDEESYATALGSDKTNSTVYHKEKGYFTVKSILLKFSDEQTAALDQIKKGSDGNYDNKQSVYDKRESLALDHSYAPNGGISAVTGGIKVNVSNPNYDPDARCKDEDCECVDCVNYKGDGTGSCEDETCTCVACVNSAYTERGVNFEDIIDRLAAHIGELEQLCGDDEAAKLNAKMDAFDDFIYMVNDDSGMFNSAGYTITPKGTSEYVAEYTTLARELVKSGVGSVGGIADGTVLPNSVDDEGLGVVVHERNGINYIVNDFGIHIIMVTYVRSDDTATEFSDGYILPLDYIVTYANEYEYDEDGNRTALVKVDNKTLEETLEKSLLDAKEGDYYSTYEKNFFAEFESKSIKMNDSLLKSIIKDYNKLLSA